MANASLPVSVRFSPSERKLLDTAVELARTNLSEFIRRRAVEAAEQDVLDRHVVSIAAADWAKFEQWVEAPPKEVPALRKLAAARPAWRD